MNSGHYVHLYVSAFLTYEVAFCYHLAAKVTFGSVIRIGREVKVTLGTRISINCAKGDCIHT